MLAAKTNVITMFAVGEGCADHFVGAAPLSPVFLLFNAIHAYGKIMLWPCLLVREGKRGL